MFESTLGLVKPNSVQSPRANRRGASEGSCTTVQAGALPPPQLVLCLSSKRSRRPVHLTVVSIIYLHVHPEKGNRSEMSSAL